MDKDRTEILKCENCVFYKKSNVDNIGNCHCHPPTKNNYWPGVYGTDYCGKFANILKVLFFGDGETTLYSRKIVSESKTDEHNQNQKKGK